MPGQPIDINEKGKTVVVTLEVAPNAEPEVGRIDLVVCDHPGEYHPSDFEGGWWPWRSE